MKLIACSAFLVLLFIVADAWFDCRREGIDCQAGSCNFGDGTCECPPGLSGEDCGLNATSISTGCNPACDNSGTCITTDAENSTLCYCLDEFYGPGCRENRSSVQCEGNNMTVKIRPYGNFAGTIYVRNNESDPDCQLQLSNNVYSKTFQMDQGCSPVVRENTPGANDTTYERSIFIKYSNLFESSLDQIVTVACIKKSEDTSSFGEQLPGQVETSDGSFNNKSTSAVSEPATFSVQQDDGSSVTRNVVVGQPLKLVFSIKDTNYVNLLVEECFATNGQASGSASSRVLNLIKDSCLTSQSKQVIRGPLLREGQPPKVTLKFRSFKFDNTGDVSFSCKVRVCKIEDSRCEPKTCDGKNTGFGRRRRDTASLDANEKVLQQKITVTETESFPVAPGTRVVEEYRAPEATSTCMVRPEIMTVLIVLAVLCLVLFLLAMLLAWRQFHRSVEIQHKELDSHSSKSNF